MRPDQSRWADYDLGDAFLRKILLLNLTAHFATQIFTKKKTILFGLFRMSQFYLIKLKINLKKTKIEYKFY